MHSSKTMNEECTCVLGRRLHVCPTRNVLYRWIKCELSIAAIQYFGSQEKTAKLSKKHFNFGHRAYLDVRSLQNKFCDRNLSWACELLHGYLNWFFYSRAFLIMSRFTCLYLLVVFTMATYSYNWWYSSIYIF